MTKSWAGPGNEATFQQLDIVFYFINTILGLDILTIMVLASLAIKSAGESEGQVLLH